MKKIFINPGHAPNGIPDPGAVNKYLGVYESEIAADIGNMLSRLLEGAGYETMVYQNDSLWNIVQMSNAWDADYFICIHCNSYVDEAAHGTEVFCFDKSYVGGRLSSCIQKRIVAKLHTADRGVKEAGYYVIRYAEAPVAYVETAFISNSSDCEKLVNRKEEFAEAIFQGILDFLEEE